MWVGVLTPSLVPTKSRPSAHPRRAAREHVDPLPHPATEGQAQSRASDSGPKPPGSSHCSLHSAEEETKVQGGPLRWPQLVRSDAQSGTPGHVHPPPRAARCLGGRGASSQRSCSFRALLSTRTGSGAHLEAYALWHGPRVPAPQGARLRLEGVSCCAHPQPLISNA